MKTAVRRFRQACATNEGRWFLIGSSTAFGTASVQDNEWGWAAMSFAFVAYRLQQWRGTRAR